MPITELSALKVRAPNNCEVQRQVELALPIQNENTSIVEELCAKLANYNLVSKDSWLWHISPQGIESQKFGTIHQVVALHYSRGAEY